MNGCPCNTLVLRFHWSALFGMGRDHTRVWIPGDMVHWGLSWRLTVHLLAPKDLYFSYLENKMHSFSDPPSPIHTHQICSYHNVLIVQRTTTTVCLCAKVKILENNLCITPLSSSISNTCFAFYTFKLYPGTLTILTTPTISTWTTVCSNFLPCLPSSSSGDP